MYICENMLDMIFFIFKSWLYLLHQFYRTYHLPIAFSEGHDLPDHGNGDNYLIPIQSFAWFSSACNATYLNYQPKVLATKLTRPYNNHIYILQSYR